MNLKQISIFNANKSPELIQKLKQDEFKVFKHFLIDSRTFKTKNFRFQTQGHLRTFKFCTNSVLVSVQVFPPDSFIANNLQDIKAM